MKLFLIILAIVLLVALATVGIIVLIQRNRAKKAEWLRVSGSVIGIKKLKLPGCWKATVLYRDPRSNKNATATTCILNKQPALHKKAALYDLMMWKDYKGKTRKTLYPVTEKTLNNIQMNKVAQRPPKFVKR